MWYLLRNFVNFVKIHGETWKCRKEISLYHFTNFFIELLKQITNVLYIYIFYIYCINDRIFREKFGESDKLSRNYWEQYLQELLFRLEFFPHLYQ